MNSENPSSFTFKNPVIFFAFIPSFLIMLFSIHSIEELHKITKMDSPLASKKENNASAKSVEYFNRY